MKPEHTPGPWNIERTHQSPCAIVPEGQTAALAKVYLTDPATRKRSPEYLANAHLVAAAPDLLAALIELERVESSPHSETVRFLAREQAREAIAKATASGSPSEPQGPHNVQPKGAPQ
jgi:hypothetical protein